MSCLNNCTKCNTNNLDLPFVVCDSCGKVLINNKEHKVNINLHDSDEIEKDTYQHGITKVMIAFAMQETDTNDWDPYWLKYVDDLEIEQQIELKKHTLQKYYHQYTDFFQPIT